MVVHRQSDVRRAIREKFHFRSCNSGVPEFYAELLNRYSRAYDDPRFELFTIRIGSHLLP
jgi:hypothetical protein